MIYDKFFVILYTTPTVLFLQGCEHRVYDTKVGQSLSLDCRVGMRVHVINLTERTMTNFTVGCP